MAKFEIKKILEKIKSFARFIITDDVWRITDSDVTDSQKKGYDFIKIITLVGRRFSEDNLSGRASALTYSTVLSLVPMLAILLSIAKGFGFQNILQNQIFDNFPGQKEVLNKVFAFVESYMQHAEGGLFLGFGLGLLLYTVLNLISGIEDNFNVIWQVKKGRPLYRKFTDYFSVFMCFPVFLVFSSGLSIFVTTIVDNLDKYDLLGPVNRLLINLSPLPISILAFTFLYMFMPNIKVKFKHAFFAGIFSGTAFIIFQYLYINGQIWVSSYNAIYGSFAFFPLLLLWLQLSWLICLIGVEISYASQNIRTYDFEADSKNITRRYYDFVILSVTTLIVKRFEKGETPYTVEEISLDHKIPIRLARQIIFDLQELDIINEVRESDVGEIYYQPALDINKISAAYLFAKIDQKGSELFKIDKEIAFNKEWNVIIQSREEVYKFNDQILLKDL